MADGQDGLMPLDFKDPFAAPAARPAAASAAPAQPMKLDFADPFEQAASAAERASHSTLGDIGRSALGALETGTGEGLQGIGDVTGWKGAQNLGKRVQAAGAREAANVSPQFAETTSKPILSKEGFNLTNIGSKAINTVAGMAPQLAATVAAGALTAEAGGVGAIPVGAALFGTQGEASGRNAAAEQVAALTPDELAKVPAYQKAIAAGATPDQARAQLSETAQTRGAVSGGLFGAGLGLVGEIPGVGAVGKFAANKLVRGVGRVAGASTALASRGAARVVGKGIGEGVGFGGINAAGQVVNNVSNPVPTSPLEGVGEAAASGLLPGFALGAGRAGVQRLLRPAGPLGRAAQTAQDAGATAPAPGVAPADATQPAAAAAATGEAPPPVTRKVAPPAVPWVNAETGETRTPAASEIVAAFHRMQDDQAQAAANNQKLVVGLSQLSSAWGVPLERLKSLRKVAINERAKGVTTNHAEQRAADDFAQQGTTDTFQQADRAIGDLNDQANTVGASLADARARLDALREQPGSESATSNDVAKPEQAPAPNAEPTTPAPDAAAVETTAKPDEAPATPPRDASAERAPEAPAAEKPVAPEPATTQPPAVAPEAGATPARAEPASAPADQAAREVPVSSSESSDKSGIGAETTPNVGENQTNDAQRSESPQPSTTPETPSTNEPATPIFTAKPGDRTQGGTLVSTHTRLKDAKAALTRGDNLHAVPWTDTRGKSRWSVVDAGGPVLSDWKRAGSNAWSGRSGTGRYTANAVHMADGSYRVRAVDSHAPANDGLAVAEAQGRPGESFQTVAARAMQSFAEAHAGQPPVETAARDSAAPKARAQGVEAVVAPGDRVTVTRGVHAGKGASVVGRTRNGVRLKFDDGSLTTLSAKVIEQAGKSGGAPPPEASTEAQVARRDAVTVSTRDLAPTHGETVRGYARETARAKFADKTFRTADGHDIIVPWQGIKHASNKDAKPGLAALLHLDKLIQSSRRIGTEPDRRRRKDIVAVHQFETAATIDGKPHKVVLFVREHADGKRYYDHALIKDEPPGIPGAATLESQAAHQPAGGSAGKRTILSKPSARHNEATANKNETPNDEHAAGRITDAEYRASAKTGAPTEVSAGADAGRPGPRRETNSEPKGPGSAQGLVNPKTPPKAPVSASSEREPAAPKKDATIDDFGEKLGGARKDQVPSLNTELGENDIRAQPLSKIWPASEVDAIADPFAAAVAHATRAEIPAKPRTLHKLDRWVKKVQAARALALHALDGKLTPDLLRGRIGLRGFAAKVELLQAIDRAQWNRIGDVAEHPDAYTYGPNGEHIPRPSVGATIDGHWERFDGAKDIADALDAIKKKLATTAKTKPLQFEIRGNRTKNEYFINKKGDGEYRHLKEFTDLAAARAYLKDNHADLVKAWDDVKARDNVTKADMRNTDNRERTGPDYRDGKDVTPEQFGENFGFRGVEFGNWVKQGGNAKERQGLLNQAYDALMDLANLIGVPPRAMSLDGSLGLGLGSRGHGWASAHFEPDRLVINLTKTRGAGAIAHEWFHALDNYFARKRGNTAPRSQGGNFITYRPEPMLVNPSVPAAGRMTRAELARRHALHPTAKLYDPADWKPDPNHPAGVRPVVEKAFAEVVNALNASPMRQRALSIDKGKSNGYWSRIVERAARSFENYVIARMDAKGISNDYLANVRKLEAFNRNPERYPYLRPEEVKPVADAFDNLFATLETRKSENGNVALFSKAPKEPNDLVTAPDGSVNFGEITRAQGDHMRRQAGSIRLPLGKHNINGTGFGLTHIEANHGKQIRRAGFQSVEGFVHYVAQHVDQIWRAPVGQLVLLARGKPPGVMFLRMEPARDAGGDYYRVNTAFPVRSEDYGSRKGWEKLWDGSEPPSSATGTRTAFAAASGDVSSPVRPNAVRQSSRHSSTARRGIDAAQLDRRVSFITRAWHGDKPNVRVVDSAEQLPAAARAEGGYERAEGYYDGKDTIYLVRENLRTAADVDRVLARHEVTHYGLDRIMDDALPGGWKRFTAETQAMRADPAKLDARTRKAMQSTEERYRNADGSPASPDVFAAELPAVMAEQGVHNRLLDRVVAAIRAHLRKWFPNLKLSPREVRQFIVQAHALVAGDGRAARARQRAQRAMVAAHAFGKAPDTFYSALDRAVHEGKGMPKKADAAAWKQWLDGAQRRGEFKGSEREWMGLDQWLDEHKGPVTRQELGDFVRDNRVQVREAMHRDEVPAGEGADLRENEDGGFDLVDADGAGGGTTKFGEYTLPGGNNYRELLLTLPQRDALTKAERTELARLTERKQTAELGRPGAKELSADESARLGALQDKAIAGNKVPFRSQHFDEPNIVAHVRMNDRTGPDGEKILHVDEVQSDMHQAGRKRGYFDAAKPWEVFETGSGDVVARFATEQQARIEAKQRGNRFDFGRGAENGAVPDAPFKKTEQWSMLAMKRVLRYAAEHGYDKVTWTTGEQQAERYDQSHQLKSVHVVAKGGEAPRVVTMDTNRGPIRLFVDNDGRVASSTASNARLRGQWLDDVIGKELATKVMDARDDTTLSGNDLKFGGEGMKAFYDRMLPNEIGKYVKKWGAKVGETTFETRPARTVRNEMDPTELGAAPPRDNGTHREAAQTATVHSIDITPAMRDSVLQGQPLFSLPETPTARDYLDQPDVPVIRLRGDEIKGATPADVRKNANEFVRRWLQELARATGGNAVHNDRTGFDIGVTQNRVHHGFVHRGPENVKLVAAMEGMLRNAAPIDRRAHVPPRDEFRQVHTLVAPLDIAGQRFAVKLTVKEAADGNYRLYDHQALKMESPDSTSGTTATGVARSRPMSGDSASIRDMLRAFKGDNAKYVPRDASANHPEKPEGSFSKPAPADPSREPARSMQDLEKALKDADPGGILTKARAWIRGKAEDLRPAALGALQTSHVLELMEHSVPLKAGARDYDRSMHQMDADRQQLMTGAADAKEHPKDMLRKGAVTIAEELRKLAYGTGLRSLRGKVRPEAQKLFNIMHQATLQRLDPSKAYERLTIENAHGDAIPWTPAEVRARLKVLRELMLQRGGDAWADREKLSDEVKYLRNIAKLEAKREADWPKLQAAYDALSPEAKRLYGEVRDWYSQYRDATEEALIKNIEVMDVPETYRRSLVNRMRLRFEEQRREGVYFPLNRDGDYWVSFQDKDGNEGFKMFEQFKDFKAGVRRLRDAGFQIDPTGRRSPNAKAKDAPSGTFVREVIDTLQKAKVSEKVQDEVYQTFLRAMPELSMRKHSIHRRNIAGFSEDALRAFAKNSYHGAHQLARLRHAQDMQMTLEAMKAGLDNWRRGENATDERAEPDPADVVKADALYAELQKRHEWIMSPNDQRLANMANSIGFIWYMGASPASALTNLTQIAQTVAPVLGARHGWGKASRMLAAAWRDAARTGGNMERLLKNDDERKAFLQMQQRGDFSKTQSHTLAGLAEGNVLQTSPAWSKTMNAVSWMFHTAELVNREATGMAAYRLARSEGKTFDEAVTYAGRVNAETNFDYSAANRPRYMQGNVQRIALQFKNYSVGMTWLFFRNVHQAFKGATPEERQIAKRTVAGIMGMTALLAGATGLPLYNAIRTTANAANALFGDDDEPWNFDDAFHRWLADNLGQDAARLIAEGPTNYLTGANLASRTSLSNLWIHDDDQRLEGADAYHALLENLAGPMGGITNNFYVAAEDVRRGHLERGIERILPTAVKNTIKSLRYAHEGVNSLRGDPIVPDVSGYEEFLQAIGFQPAKVADQYRINTAMKNYTGEIKDRRGNLMNAYALAVKAGDSQDQQQAMQRIAAFNRAHPEVAVTRPVLMSSLRQRARLSAQAQHGIILNRKMAAQAQAYVGGAQ